MPLQLSHRPFQRLLGCQQTGRIYFDNGSAVFIENEEAVAVTAVVFGTHLDDLPRDDWGSVLGTDRH